MNAAEVSAASPSTSGYTKCWRQSEIPGECKVLRSHPAGGSEHRSPIEGDIKQGDAALSCIRPTWKIGLRVPGCKRHRLAQGTLPEFLCICRAWLGENTQATSPETAASGTGAGADQTDESLCHGLRRLSASCHRGAPYLRVHTEKDISILD